MSIIIYNCSLSPEFYIELKISRQVALRSKLRSINNNKNSYLFISQSIKLYNKISDRTIACSPIQIIEVYSGLHDWSIISVLL